MNIRITTTIPLRGNKNAKRQGETSPLCDGDLAPDVQPLHDGDLEPDAPPTSNRNNTVEITNGSNETITMAYDPKRVPHHIL